MWIYKGRSAEARFQLDATLGRWVDYWLLLNAHETHPLWCARPIGLKALVEVALRANNKQDVMLRRQLGEEIFAASALSSSLGSLPPRPTSAPLAGNAWNPDWLRWMESVAALAPDSILFNFVSTLAESLERTDWPKVLFLTRRFAAELGDSDWTPSLNLIAIKSAFVDRGAIDSFSRNKFTELITTALISDRKTIYTVIVPVVPVLISRVAATSDKRWRRLNCESQPNSTRLLKSIELEVEAATVQQAAAIALETSRATLESLRLNHYVRTHLAGKVTVRSSELESPVHLDLPQPFWNKSLNGGRAVPRLPVGFNRVVRRLPHEERLRWKATRWHLSQAFADWTEDAHSAATHAWHAIESFSKAGGWTAILNLVPQFVDVSLPNISAHLVHRVVRQRVELESIGYVVDWYGWNPRKVDLRLWLRRVIHPASAWCHTHWKSPLPPAILFDRDSGLLQIAARKLNNRRTEAWIERKLMADLKLLYGLRNGAVHAGSRHFGQGTAHYFAQTACEILFDVMASRALEISNPNELDDAGLTFG